jgi:aryl-phospho-beta-D-glucosidase BglC (GH1 family)
MTDRWKIAVAAVVALLPWVLVPYRTSAQEAEHSPTAIPQMRLAALRHGVNLSDWLRQPVDGPAFSREQFDAAITTQDLASIRAMGFEHVRLCVNPAPLLRPREAERLQTDALQLVDAAVQMILDAGLAVDLDLQPDEAFKRQLLDDRFVEQFADFWRALAKHYSAIDPDRLFFEVINEPELGDPYRWYGVESRLAAAIRDGAPRHTIIATGAHFSDDDDLLFLQPLRDPDVVYAFHFYQPFLFTHQGATWAEYFWHFLEGVPYPARRDAAQRAASKVPDPLHRLAVERYGESHWDASRVDFEIDQVARWADRWKVPVICNEFGVYKATADPAERVAWIRDVRTSLEKHGIGWAVWDYNGSFGLVTKQDGRTLADQAALRALGLGAKR